MGCKVSHKGIGILKEEDDRCPNENYWVTVACGKVEFPTIPRPIPCTTSKLGLHVSNRNFLDWIWKTSGNVITYIFHWDLIDLVWQHRPACISTIPKTVELTIVINRWRLEEVKYKNKHHQSRPALKVHVHIANSENVSLDKQHMRRTWTLKNAMPAEILLTNCSQVSNALPCQWPPKIIEWFMFKAE